MTDVRCEHCGAGLPAFALFCGDCGRSVAASSLVPPVAAPAQPPAVPLVRAEPAALLRPAPVPERAVEPTRVDEPAAALVPAPTPGSTPAGLACMSCGALADPDDRYCGDCGTPLDGATRIIETLSAPLPSTPQAAPPVLPAPQATLAPSDQTTPPVAPTSPSVVTAPGTPTPAVADESTPIVPRGTGGAPFVLQFSTGESYTVLGSGLAGRNPRPEPGEYVDHLVTVVDPGRSVSKTHFEFGQEGGVFWFSDRHSGNGSVIREPGAPARPCIPGHRYPIVRGTRIEIGEQFVVVS